MFIISNIMCTGKVQEYYKNLTTCVLTVFSQISHRYLIDFCKNFSFNCIDYLVSLQVNSSASFIFWFGVSFFTDSSHSHRFVADMPQIVT